tara:strand:- start:1759 stop:3144 length:1386 start_codon:yes stop_codon:yes gene_type:complete
MQDLMQNSIQNLIQHLLNIKEFEYIKINNKFIHSHVSTPYTIVKQMIDLIPNEMFYNKDYKWLDPGCGYGHFSIIIYQKLFKSIRPFFIDDIETHNHIVENMLYMIDVNDNMIDHVKKLFGSNCNATSLDFLQWNPDLKFDFIIGNPPYVIGTKKVPTNNKLKKNNDGTTCWHLFIKHAVDLLNANKYLCFIVPSLWMRIDKANMYYYMNSYTILKLICYNNTESNKIFNKECQTPTSIFLLQNKKNNHDEKSISIYDQIENNYIYYRFKLNEPIPMFGASLIQLLQPYTNKYGSLINFVDKTNTPSKKANIVDVKDKEHIYHNVKTCLLNKNKPYLVYQYSNKPLAYYGIPKLILSHKMYGFSYYDKDGKYGISSRDNYVICDLKHEELEILHNFFNNKIIILLFECTRYRMKCLEKNIFELIPNILKMHEFNFSLNFLFLQKKNINEFIERHIKNYEFF